MNPKFSVGEVVLLDSKSYPEFNGEAIVLGIVPTSAGIDREGERVYVGQSCAYRLTIDAPVLNKCWHELALRKKHNPGEMTFESLMSSLNHPVNVES